MKISACWIAKNEAANIGLSIDSVKDIADELIVVDTGSADDTAAVAESLGARAGRFEWIGDFSAARNYAMSLASGDVIIFLDADEYFTPRLGPADRGLIEKMFSKNSSTEMLTLSITNLDKKTGAILSVSMVPRIFRNRETLRFKGRIHEFVPSSSPALNLFIPDQLSITHTGYSGDVAASKRARNTAMLESELNGAAKGSEERMGFLMYLLREHRNREDEGFERASGYLAEVLEYPDVLQSLCRSLSDEFVSVVYAAIGVAFLKRGEVSRRDVRRKLFDLFKKVYPKYPGTAEIDVLYQALFDLKESAFLKEFEPALKAASRMDAGAVSYYKDNERIMYEKAALAYWRRGDRVRAMEYAVSALKGDRAGRSRSMLHILLNTMKGQPPEDVVLFLNGIFKVSDQADLDFLINGTCIDGFLVVHTYYLRKRIDSEDAFVRYHLKFMLMYRKYDALVSLAASARAAGDVDAALYLFLAAVCGAPPDLIEAHAGTLGEYTRILDAYYKRERLAELTERDVNLIRETYSTVALAAGFETADKYLDVFMARPDACFLARAVYCEISGLPDQLLRGDICMAGRRDFPCRRYIVQAMVAAGRHAEALAEIEFFLEEGFVKPELLHMLQIIAEKAQPDTAEKARRLYGPYSAVYDAVIDLGDVVKTGIVFDDGGKKQNQFFKNMTRAQFDKYIAEEAARPAVGELLDLYRKAADIYRQRGLAAEAARCLWRLIAHGRADGEVCGSLAGIFTELKNTALPDYIRTLGNI